jgi:hypothetical protein
VIFTSVVCFCGCGEVKHKLSEFDYRVFSTFVTKGKFLTGRRRRLSVEKLHNAYLSSNIVRGHISRKMRWIDCAA